jgi:formylglycine-generating enzyme required for sulfatase activity
MRGAGAIAVGAAVLGASAVLAVETAPGGMATLPAGSYRPFLGAATPRARGVEPERIRRVEAFRLGVEPVTNAEFLAFVTARPRWRKSQIKAVFADEGYLRRWPSDLGLADEWTLDFDADADSADGALACGGAAARASDPADYPASIRTSMRASLKASYAVDNLGFRCAGGAP